MQNDGAGAVKFGVLADLFEGAGAKVLTEVEINRQRSNQHEFQGVSGFREFLGTPAEKQTFPATFYWLGDDEDTEPVKVGSLCTLSDVRREQPGRSPECHLYYAAGSEPVVHRARAGDQVVIARGKDGPVAQFKHSTQLDQRQYTVQNLIFARENNDLDSECLICQRSVVTA